MDSFLIIQELEVFHFVQYVFLPKVLVGLSVQVLK